MGNGIANDDKVFTSNINTVTNLTISSLSISDLTGVEDFAALEILHCEGNMLTNIDVTQNTTLKELYYSTNQITNIDVSQNTLLEKLYVFSNQLKIIDVSNNVLLERLYCQGNLIENIDVSLNTNLTVLQCDNNNLMTLNIANGNNSNMALFAHANSLLTCIQADSNAGTPVANTQIDSQTSFNTNCSYAETNVPDNAFENYLETHDRDGNTVALNNPSSMGNGVANDAKVFTYRINTVTLLDVSNVGLTLLTGLEDFRDLEVFGAFGGNSSLTSADFSNNLKLKRITFTYNSNATSVKFGNLQDVEYIQLGYNNITNVDISGLPKLEEFKDFSGKLTSLDTSGNPNLRILALPTNELTLLDVSSNVILEQLSLPNNQLTILNIANGNNSTITTFSTVGNQNLTCITADVSTPVAGLTGWDIDAQHNFSGTLCTTGLTYVPDDAFEQALIDLGHDSGSLDDYVPTVYINTITNLDISDPINNANLPNVTTKISDLTGIEDFVALEVLKVHENNLSSIDISSNIALNQLFVNSNNLPSINVTSNVLLEVFYINGNQITNFNLSQNIALKELYCSANLLSSIDVSKNINLIKLQCAENQIKILDVSKNLSLTHLNTHLNLIENIDIIVNTSLKLLQCNNNNLKTLNIANGNNSNLGLWAYANPLLTCIQADTNSGPPSANTQIDSQTSFNTDCSYPETNVPDPIFENYLETHDRDGNIVALNSPLSMGNGIANDMKVFTHRISAIVQLYPTSIDIADLTGLQDFISLEIFGILGGNNSLITADFSANTNLKNIKLKNTPTLTSITLASLSNVTFLDISGNALINIDVSGLPNLEEFFVGNNPLNVLNILQNPKLKFLHCQNTQFTNLDTSQNPDFESLFCIDSQIINLDFTNNQALTGITCYNSSSLASINLPNNPNLIFVDAHHTGISSLDLSTSPLVSTLDLYDTQLTALNLDANPAIVYLLAYNNPMLTTFSIKNGNNNGLSGSSFATLNSPNLTCIEVSDANYATTTWTQIDSQQRFSTNCSLTQTNIPDDNFEAYLETHDANGNVVALGASNSMGNGVSNDNYVFTNRIDTITNLEVSNLSISEMTGIEDFTALEKLICWGNNLTSLNVSNNFLLKELNFFANSITSINLTNNNQLTILDCSSNSLSSLDVDPLINLQTLISGNNSFTTLNVSLNTGLLEFSCNGLSTIDISNNLILKQLTLGDVNISNIDLSLHTDLNLVSIASMNQLTGLDLSQNQQITIVSMYNNPVLENLNIKNSQNQLITSFTSDNNPKLFCIQVDDVSFSNTNWGVDIDSHSSFNTDCSSTWVVNTSAATTTALLTIAGLDADNDGNITLAEAAAYSGPLNLSGQSLTDVEGLQAFTNITVIDIQNNNIADFSPLTDAMISIIAKSTGKTKVHARSGAFNLEELLISNNNAVETLDVSKLTNLTKLIIKDNPNLVTLSVKNGNNLLITEFDSTNSPKLTCILVDDINGGYLTSWSIDTTAGFAADEADCRARVLAITDFDINNQISLYPNPVNDILKITISNNLEIESIEVFNVIGKRVIKTTLKEIRFKDYNSGVYFVRIKTTKGIITKKIIKN
ncbi:MAG: T9SS type A sorting domain-containing protein [Polaribacter sp.]|uniref:T9SS type A sorting domain-containing protein n=1 Tax=Polaribacter sp. TaxID=1920175 RepID=UPI002F359714